MALGLPLSAAWWSALKPLLLVSVMSALWSSRRVSMSSLFLLMASCRGVSPSQSCRLGWQPRSSRVLTTPTCPLLTAMWRGVWRRLLRAFRSAPALASRSMTLGSSPNAVW
uniref:Putative secreted protein n=1 Tax=Ixodes ricinus TaxID=34613 RepID=A0A147BQ52_IXORI